jgi:serine/threonine protein phosphatase PrpC
MVDDRRLQILLMSRAEPERKVHALISEANGRGGLDNITAIVVQIAPEEDGAATASTQPSSGATPSARPT